METNFIVFFPPILSLLCRVGGSYDERRFVDERYSRDNIYQRGAFNRDAVDREAYPPSGPAVGHWSESKRRGYDEDYLLDKESRRLQRPYYDSYQQIDAFRDRDVDMYPEFDKFQDGYAGIDNYDDREYDKLGRFRGHDRDDYAYDDYGHRSRASHHYREDSHDRDIDHGRHSHDSDYGRGRRDSNWRRRGSRDREHDRRHPSRERDLSPHKRHEQSWSRSRSPSRSRSRSHSHPHSRSRSQSHGYDDHSRSRSPRGRSHGRSYREDNYADYRYDRSEKRRDREEKRRDHYSVVCVEWCLFSMFIILYVFLMEGFVVNYIFYRLHLLLLLLKVFHKMPTKKIYTRFL